MGLSSQLAPSAIARPGVIANAAARPASPYDGQVIYQQDTDQAYVWNGSAWVLLSTGTANPVGLELVKTQTVGSAVSSVTVSNAFSSAYDNYKILIAGGSASTTNVLRLTFGSAATAYYWSFLYSVYGTTTASADTGNNATFILYAGQMQSAGVSADITVIAPYLSKSTMVQAWNGFGGGTYGGTVSGGLSTTTSYTDFTLTCNSGTMSDATIRVYGYKN